MKTIVVLPAYNAAKTLPFFLNTITNVFDEIILVDDYSSDGTYELAKKQKGISAYQTPRNLGYGGNLKYCLSLALEHQADVIVELHPDGEYETDGISPALKKVKEGADLVLGNRFSGRLIGMQRWKNIGTRTLTAFDNLILGTSIPDLHQGFRVYTRALLEALDYRAFRNDYLFSFQFILAALWSKAAIAWVPVSTYYHGSKRGASARASLLYSLGTFSILAAYLLARFRRNGEKTKKAVACPICQNSYLVQQRLRVGKFTLWFCQGCLNGFTYPVPKDLVSYYDASYWNYQGIVGNIKQMVFFLCQKRRVGWIRQYLTYGDILDVGAGEGIFAQSLPKDFQVRSIEPVWSKVQNPNVSKVNFLTWPTKKRFDAVCFWESLEHVADPASYLVRANKLVEQDGWLFIEYPRWNCLESKIFASRWFHLDMPRHTLHFTDLGLRSLCESAGFTVIKQRPIAAWEYTPWGVAMSLLGRQRDCSLSGWQNVLVIPALVVGMLISIFFVILAASPIGLVVARKTSK